MSSRAIGAPGGLPTYLQPHYTLLWCSTILVFMRRALASLLLAIWVAGICAPLLAAQPKLPACCRADGKHHCASHSSGDGFHAAPCSFYQHWTALTSSSVTALGVQARFAVLGSHWHGSPVFHSPDIARAQAGDVQKRGPPLA